jgi:hypothetical protein
MPAYRAYNKQDVEEFQTMLYTFSCHLPVLEDVDLVADWEYMYDGCLGCIGTLQQWLERALYRALNASELKHGTRHLVKPFRHYLDLCPVPEEKRTEMMESIIQYDNLEMEAEGKYASARSRFASKPLPPQKEPEDSDGAEGKDQGKGIGTGSRGREKNGAKPFQVNPKRYPVGPAA